jgi:glycosyltransferase involved in cell wall biosynthesis
VVEALGRGGAERLILDTARRLDAKRFALRVYTLFSARRDYADALGELGIPETCLGLRALDEALPAALRLRAIFKRDAPDVVHTHLFAANLVGRLAAWLSRCPVVSTYHDADYEPIVRVGNPGLTRVKQLLLQALDVCTVALTRPRLLAVSEYVAASVRRRIRAEGVQVLPNGVDTTIFRPDPDRRLATRARLGLAPSARVVACVGRMTPQKGQVTLINAMAQVSAAVEDSHLLLVGDGPDRAELQRLAKTVGSECRVCFLGVRPDVPDLLRAADVLALPSVHEGFGLVLIEALATGVPVVASRTGPVPEIVEDGVTGLLVPVGDTRRLAEAITTLLVDRRLHGTLSERGRVEAQARFDVSTMLSTLDQLYCEMAGPQN